MSEGTLRKKEGKLSKEITNEGAKNPSNLRTKKLRCVLNSNINIEVP